MQVKQKAIFLDRDGVLNTDEVAFITAPEALKLYPFAAEAVKIINQSGFLAILVTNQSAIARNLITEQGLHKIHKKLTTELAKHGTKLDAIYYCPHLPKHSLAKVNSKYTINCGCRKPKPGMLNEAAKKFNINKELSYLIGDSERDILAGRAAGCKTVGVKTGNALANATIKPDYFFENVLKAIQFIIKKH